MIDNSDVETKQPVAPWAGSGQTLTVDQSSATPLYVQVEDAIRQQIAVGQLIEGQKLPPLRQLSEDLGVAYVTVVRGVQNLVAEGSLEAFPRRGTFVARARVRQAQTTGLLSAYSYNRLISKTRYYRNLLFMIQEGLVQEGQSAVYRLWPEGVPLETALKQMHSLDALVLLSVPPEHLDDVKAVQRRGTPLICVGDTFQDPEVPAVHTTNEQDTVRAYAALRTAGHHKIVGALPPKGSGHYSRQCRLEGFRKAVKEFGGAWREDWLIHGEPEEQARQLLNMPEPPTALMVLDDVSVFGTLFQLLKGSHVEPGKDVYIAAWDENLWNTISPLGFPYISIEQPLQHIADVAVAELKRMVNDPTYRPAANRLSSSLYQVADNGVKTLIY